MDLDPDVVRVLEQLALPVPDPANPIVCHGFGCAYRTPILLRNADKAQIKKLFGPAAVKSAEEERKALAATMAWFEKRVAGGSWHRNRQGARGTWSRWRPLAIRLSRQDEQHGRRAHDRG